jgi:hypothetical protein
MDVVLKQFDFETPPPSLNGESKFRPRLRGGRRRFALMPPEHFHFQNPLKSRIGSLLRRKTQNSGLFAREQCFIFARHSAAFRF